MANPVPSSRAPGKSLSRRAFLGTVAKTSLAASVGVQFGFGNALGQSAPGVFKKVCLIATEVRKYSHAQHFVDRLLEGYGWQGQHHYPPLQLVSMYVDQFPDGDLSRERAERHKIRIYPSISEALCLGGSKLAVDGVLIIGEHGKYPRNAKGQTLYPRYKFFKEVMKVFEESERAVPVFNDKHLSTDWKECVEMVADSKRLGFPFLAGSSLPVTWRIPSVDMPLGTALQESVAVGYGGVDSYDFHGLETAQCMSERRAGGEVGVHAVHAVKGEAVWTALAQRPTTSRLVQAALARSHTCAPPPGYTFGPPTIEGLKEASRDPFAYFFQHLDGFQTTLLMLNGIVQDFTYAGLIKESVEVLSCQMYLPMPPAHATLADFFNPLMNHIEQTILTGRASYPVERTLLTSGMTLSAVDSLFKDQAPVLTPELKVAYQVDNRSTFWRS